VIEGEVEFGFDGERRLAGPGTLVHLPGGTVHWFRFGARGARMFSITGPSSGAAGFFAELARALPDGSVDAGTYDRVASDWGVKFA
jgi:quercetin dioxygenase-like cupin family protein